MCTPKNAGGRRCAAHTRPAFQAAVNRANAAKTTRQAIDAQVDGMLDIARHAATPTGRRETENMYKTAKRDGDLAIALYLEDCLEVARGMRRMQARIDEDTATHRKGHQPARRSPR